MQQWIKLSIGYNRPQAWYKEKAADKLKNTPMSWVE